MLSADDPFRELHKLLGWGTISENLPFRVSLPLLVKGNLQPFLCNFSLQEKMPRQQENQEDVEKWQDNEWNFPVDHEHFS